MSKQFTQGDYLDIFTEFTKQLQKNQMMMIENWNDPMEYTMNSIFQFSDMANDMVDQLAQQHTAAMESFFPQGAYKSTTTGSAVTSQPDTGHVAVVTGGIEIGRASCRERV